MMHTNIYFRLLSGGTSHLLHSAGQPILTVHREPIVDLFLFYLHAKYATNQRLESRPKILQVIRVQKRIHGRVQVRQNDKKQRQPTGNFAVLTERLDKVERVQWQPADHEKQHDNGEVLCGFDFALASRTENA